MGDETTKVPADVIDRLTKALNPNGDKVITREEIDGLLGKPLDVLRAIKPSYDPSQMDNSGLTIEDIGNAFEAVRINIKSSNVRVEPSVTTKGAPEEGMIGTMLKHGLEFTTPSDPKNPQSTAYAFVAPKRSR